MEKKEVTPLTQEYLQSLGANPQLDLATAMKELAAALRDMQATIGAQAAALSALIHTHPRPGEALEHFLQHVDLVGNDPAVMSDPERRARTAEALAALRPLFEAAYRQRAVGG